MRNPYDPMLPPMASDRDDYFTTTETPMKKSNRGCTSGDHDDCRSISCRCECHIANPPVCEMTGCSAPAFTQTSDTRRWQCVDCAAQAGHREAILMRSQQSALQLLSEVKTPEAA